MHVQFTVIVSLPCAEYFSIFLLCKALCHYDFQFEVALLDLFTLLLLCNPIMQITI